MKRFLILPLLCLMAGPSLAAEDLVMLDVEIYRDGDRVSSPRLAMKPGSDGSIQQGLEDGKVLFITFHSTHLTDSAVEMLIDTDLGIEHREHIQTAHDAFEWDKRFEQVFSQKGWGSIRIVVTPSRVDGDELPVMK